MQENQQDHLAAPGGDVMQAHTPSNAGQQTREELEQTSFFQAGVRARQQRRKLAEAVACLRFGCWQYDAFIAGYDSLKSKKKEQA
jgi:hypothetical protein